jgi:hypothetical protein
MRRRGIEEHEGGLGGELHDPSRRSDGAQIEDAPSTRRQDQIGGLVGAMGAVSIIDRDAPASLAVSRALAIRLGCRDVTLGVSLSRVSAHVAEEACGSTSRTATLWPRRSAATARCSAIVDFPEPPLPDRIATVFIVSLAPLSLLAS